MCSSDLASQWLTPRATADGLGTLVGCWIQCSQLTKARLQYRGNNSCGFVAAATASGKQAWLELLCAGWCLLMRAVVLHTPRACCDVAVVIHVDVRVCTCARSLAGLLSQLLCCCCCCCAAAPAAAAAAAAATAGAVPPLHVDVRKTACCTSLLNCCAQLLLLLLLLQVGCNTKDFARYAAMVLALGHRVGRVEECRARNPRTGKEVITRKLVRVYTPGTALDMEQVGVTSASTAGAPCGCRQPASLLCVCYRFPPGFAV
jgi:hypothetical protein